MREKVQTQGAGTVELDFNLYVAGNLAVAVSVLVLPVAYISVDHNPVVEQLRADRDVENVVALVVLLVLQAEVQRYAQLREYIVQLIANQVHGIGVYGSRGAVVDASLLVLEEVVRQQQGQYLPLYLVLGAKRALHPGLHRRVEVRYVYREVDLRLPELASHLQGAVHVPAGVH